MKRIFTALALVLYLPSTVLAGNPQTHIEETASVFKAAFNAGDAAAVAGLYSEMLRYFLLVQNGSMADLGFRHSGKVRLMPV